MKDTKNATIVISIISVAVFIVAIVAVSFAYYTSNVTTKGEDGGSTNINTAHLSTRFTDGPLLTFSQIIPGDTFSKTFTLENNGGTEIRYKVVINDLVNELTKTADLEYTLTKGEEKISSGTFPTTTGAISDVITIQNGKTHTYTLTVTYKNTAEDQSDDMGKTISGKLFIEEV